MEKQSAVGLQNTNQQKEHKVRRLFQVFIIDLRETTDSLGSNPSSQITVSGPYMV